MVPAISSTDSRLDSMMPPRKAKASCLPTTVMLIKAIRLMNAIEGAAASHRRLHAGT